MPRPPTDTSSRHSRLRASAASAERRLAPQQDSQTLQKEPRLVSLHVCLCTAQGPAAIFHQQTTAPVLPSLPYRLRASAASAERHLSRTLRQDSILRHFRRTVPPILGQDSLYCRRTMAKQDRKTAEEEVRSQYEYPPVFISPCFDRYSMTLRVSSVTEWCLARSSS